jgi:hypothetical protein
MLQPFREIFNSSQFSPERYAELLRRLNQRTRTDISFRICETPCFFDRALLDHLGSIGQELTHQLVDSPSYMRHSDRAVPSLYRVAHENPKPNFMTVDFGFVRDEAGELQPRLVELQAFPSIFGYQDVLCEEYQRIYNLDPQLEFRLSGLTESGYWDLLRRAILGAHDPENVVLMEIEPETQKTLPDFHVYEDRLGVNTVDLARLQKRGRKLYYRKDGREIPIHRIFNRAIVDELERKNIRPAFDFRDELDVEWAGQPNWYFRASKFSLPFLEHPCVPKAVFLDDWLAGRREGLPEDHRELLLKPLYSFAGKGIQFAPSLEDLASIEPRERVHYLVQERVHFEPVIVTPFGETQVEVRIMYVWPDEDVEMLPVTSLVRLGRGLMMGVDHNREQAWVGGSAAFLHSNATR